MASNPRIDDLRKRLEREPGSRLFAQLAEELRKVGELDEAIRVAREGLARHPAYPSARMTLGRALFDLGDRRAACEELRAVVAAAPDNILAYRLLGEALEGQGLFDEAAAHYRTVLLLAPGDKAAEARLAALALRATAVADDDDALAATVVLPRSAPPPSEPAPPPAHEAAPIPLAAVEEEDFELERPADTTARLMALEPTVLLSRYADEAPAAPAAPVTPESEVAAVEPGFGAGREELVFDFDGPGSEPTLPFAPAPSASAIDQAGASVDAPAIQVAPLDDDILRPVERLADDEEPAAAAPEISSPTLAELYFAQGVPDKAAAVYHALLEREPWNARARARLLEIEAALQAGAARAVEAQPFAPPTSRREALERTIRRLEGFLAAVRESRSTWPVSPTP